MSLTYTEDVCKCHGEKRLIVNKTHKLCQEGNRARLDENAGGKGKKAKGLAAIVRLRGVTPLKRSKRVKSKSTKQRGIDSEYSLVLKELEFEREHICSGCGTTSNLTPSHLVPRSFNRLLVTNKRNIQFHCTTVGEKVGCHEKWESNSLRNELSDFCENMETVRELDVKYYNIISVKTKGWEK